MIDLEYSEERLVKESIYTDLFKLMIDEKTREIVPLIMPKRADDAFIKRAIEYHGGPEKFVAQAEYLAKRAALYITRILATDA